MFLLIQSTNYQKDIIMENLLNAKEIDNGINAIRRMGKTFNAKSQVVAVSAMHHAEQYGDNTKLTRLVNAMPNSTRKQGMIAYIEAFTPQNWKEKDQAFKKGKRQYLIQDAMAIAWYEFTKEKPVKALDLDKLLDFAKLQKAAQAQVDKAIEEGREVKGDIEAFNSRLNAEIVIS
tara:strand:+ start:1090 stop:1614 length:525 start_codon:yes stop_codon:yes gene_type:complete